MFDEQVVEYIKKASEAGRTKEQIRSDLAANGWTEIEINDSFLKANEQPESTKYQSQPQKQEQTDNQPSPQSQQSAENVAIKSKYEQKIEPKTELKAEPVGKEIKQSDYIPDINQSKAKENQKATEKNRQGEYVYQKQQTNFSQKNNKSQDKVTGFLISFASIIMILALGGAGFLYFEPVKYIKNLLNSFNPVVIETTEENISKEQQTRFAEYNLQNTSYSAQLPEYSISLAEIKNLSNFETSSKVNFTEAQKDSLIKNNFFIASNFDKFYSSDVNSVATRNDDWTGLYKQIGGAPQTWYREPENAVFITSDYLTHIYHKLVEQNFIFIEESKFYPTLLDLSNLILEFGSLAYNSAEGPQKDSYERISAYFLVSSAVLQSSLPDYQAFEKNNYVSDSNIDSKENVLKIADELALKNNISDYAKDTAKQEIELIFEASKVIESPLMGKFQPDMKEDYTQYTPRSHYAKNSILRSYFKTMMWFGRTNFLIKSVELTRDAVNIKNLLSEEILQKWESIYQPTTFFVGASDDLSVYDFSKAMEETGVLILDQSDDAIIKLQETLKNYQNPQIMSSVIVSESVLETSKEDLQNSTKGFRFMGQRFTPDAFIFSTLTQGDEAPDSETGQKLPSLPTSLMVSTLMGDANSKELLNIWVQKNASNSDKVLENKMQDLQTYFDKTTQDQWTQNIYWSWLYTIKSLFKNTDTSGYPMFMKNSDWKSKQTQSFLGSWTELKHDTLLYAKQSYAELGAGGDEQEPNPVVKGYVEPNIEFFDRLIALVNMTTDGLEKFNLIPENLKSKNSIFLENLEFFRKIAVLELQNETISEDDFEKLRLSAYSLDQILQTPDSQVQLESNARSALIADVHTDICNRNNETGKCSGAGQILYEADGIPNYIYVAVKDANGTRLTKGLVYSYYEFTDKISKRLTDQTWQNWNYSSTIKLLKMPDWNKSLIK
jgi:hypothetical protein